MIILGIETSCDDTGISIIRAERNRMTSLAHVRYSQIKTHAQYGGVVPEIAAREHTVTIIPTIHTALDRAHLTFHDIDRLAVTQGPGLAPALSVGLDTARIISALHHIPAVGIQHIEGHMLSVWPIAKIPKSAKKRPRLPLLSLVVSGGHTQLVVIKKIGVYKVLGKTRDDAAGEAFDKVAALIGLPYPGGPEISRLAKQGNPLATAFPRPMLSEPNLDFSFSGLKTAVRYYIADQKKLSIQKKRDIAASFQRAVIDVLVGKTLRAAEALHFRGVSLVGGVSANAALRRAFADACKKRGYTLYLAPPQLTQDNATMIAMVAALTHARAKRETGKRLDPRPAWEVA